LPVYHFDFFRLQDRQAALNIGLDEYFFGDGVSVVEWADRFPQLIPESARWLDFDIMAGEQRRIDIR
jgi:tRNA threonylcarbamoyladenosine biosynthesis protein TsaE